MKVQSTSNTNYNIINSIPKKNVNTEERGIGVEEILTISRAKYDITDNSSKNKNVYGLTRRILGK